MDKWGGEGVRGGRGIRIVTSYIKMYRDREKIIYTEIETERERDRDRERKRQRQKERDRETERNRERKILIEKRGRDGGRKTKRSEIESKKQKYNFHAFKTLRGAYIYGALTVMLVFLWNPSRVTLVPGRGKSISLTFSTKIQNPHCQNSLQTDSKLTKS